MKYTDYYDQLSPDGKKNLAERLGCSLVYLCHLRYGRRRAGRKFLLGIESATDGKVRPHDFPE